MRIVIQTTSFGAIYKFDGAPIRAGMSVDAFSALLSCAARIGNDFEKRSIRQILATRQAYAENMEPSVSPLFSPLANPEITSEPQQNTTNHGILSPDENRSH